jgi:hypothetical protein
MVGSIGNIGFVIFLSVLFMSNYSVAYRLTLAFIAMILQIGFSLLYFSHFTRRRSAIEPIEDENSFKEIEEKEKEDGCIDVRSA